MDFEVINSEQKLCTCCMEEHEVKTVRFMAQVTFKNKTVNHVAEYYYCSNVDEFFADETQLRENDSRMKDAYRKSVGLLTSEDICLIRSKYGISQSDLCTLLDWGGKTIARYENHQVQDKAHDAILRKLDADPAWFLDLLSKSKDSLSPASYRKYLVTGKAAYKEHHERLLKYKEEITDAISLIQFALSKSVSGEDCDQIARLAYEMRAKELGLWRES